MRQIGNKQVEMSDKEFDYYTEILGNLRQSGENKPEDFFIDLFDADQDGFINIIKPTKTIPWVVLFFVQQLMISQRLRLMDKFCKRIK